MSSKNDLTINEATTTQLIAELMKRCPQGIVVITTPDDRQTADTRRVVWGSRPWCVGVAHIVRNELTEEFIDESKDDRDDNTH